MDLNKIPRWALVFFAMVGIGAVGLVGSTARADLEKFKAIAADAKVISDANAESIENLNEAVEDIRRGQEIFRTEYRDDQIRAREAQSNMEQRIIKAVKS